MDANVSSGGQVRARRRRRAGVLGVGGAAAAVLAIAGCNLGAPAVEYPLTAEGNFTTDLALGDVDNDGDVDVVGAVHGGYAVGLGDGDGGFAVRQVQTSPGPGWLTTLGDVDGDGNLDLVSIASSASGDPPQVEVRRGDGTGRFATTRRILPAGHAPRELALGDLDGDGDLDVVAATAAGAGVWLNGGSGVFAAPFAVDTGTNASDVVLHDLDEDGHLDLVTGGFSATAAVSVNLGDGDGGFEAPTAYGVGSDVAFSGPTVVGVADMNGDGVPDVYGANAGFDQVFVFPGEWSGRLGSPILSPARTRTVPDIVAADFDVDGHLDLATAGSTVLFGDGAGRFPEEHPIYAGNIVTSADVDANGQPDLLCAEGEMLRVLLNHLDGRRDHDDA